MTVIDNPYPASTVAVFGGELPRTVKFGFMREALKKLMAYLEGYPNVKCALPLSGGHGSGKTHLLNWMSSEVQKLQHGDAKVIYTKSNNSNPVDFYHQVVSNWTRDDLLAVQRQALTMLGARDAGSIKATEAAAKKITDYKSLILATQEKILDINALHIKLREEVVRSAASDAADTFRRMAAAIGLLDDPAFGEAAFSWIRGEPVSGLPNEALQTGLFALEGDRADTAIYALQVLAALFRLAEIPMIIMIDEIENLLASTDRTGKASSIKKLVEQLSRQGAALVMAGTPAGWEKMPRDLGPRMTQRKPLVVGALTKIECDDLLQSPLTVRLGHGAGISDQAVKIIHELSGGNPREIFRIAFHAFEAAGGDLATLDRELLLGAASNSGTLEDRRLLAEQLIEQVAEEEAAVLTRGKEDHEFHLQGPAQSLRILLVVAANATAESQLARSTTAALAEHSDDRGGNLIVAVGYSSESVRKLLGGVSDIITFDEMRLKSELRNRLRRLDRPVPPSTGGEQVDKIGERLERLDRMLADIQQSRAESDRQVANLIEARTVSAAAPEREAAELRTRYELRDGLDDLSLALAEREPQSERRAIRRLLIANEINVKDQNFDFLGSLYLEGLDLERLHLPAISASEHPADALADLRATRGDIVREMRTYLTRQHSQSTSRRFVVIIQAAIGGMMALVAAHYAVAMARYQEARAAFIGDYGISAGAPSFSAYLNSLSPGTALLELVIGAVVGLTIFAVLEMLNRPEIRYRKLRFRLRKVRTYWERISTP
ncbi:MAG TPA: hypothetical protein VF603_05015 [Allosphingosinicella sp.]|jgi:hypothetical protein